MEQKQESPQQVGTHNVTNGEKNVVACNDTRSEEIQKLDDKVVEDTESQYDILEVKDSWPDHLWSQVQHAKQGSQTFDSAPLQEVRAKKP